MLVFEKYLHVICWIVLVSFAGCVTTRIDYVEPDNLKKHNVYRIAVIYMKDGTIYDMLGIESKLKMNYKGLGNMIVFKTAEGETKIINITDIYKLKIEVMENNVLATSLIIVGSVMLAVFILLMILGVYHGSATG